MNEHTRKQLTRFMGILKALGLTKDEIFGICSFLKTESMVAEMITKLEEKDFKLTPYQVKQICYQVIEDNL